MVRAVSRQVLACLCFVYRRLCNRQSIRVQFPLLHFSAPRPTALPSFRCQLHGGSIVSYHDQSCDMCSIFIAPSKRGLDLSFAIQWQLVTACVALQLGTNRTSTDMHQGCTGPTDRPQDTDVRLSAWVTFSSGELFLSKRCEVFRTILRMALTL